VAKSFSGMAGSGRESRVASIAQISANQQAAANSANQQADDMQDSLASDTDRIRRLYATRGLMRAGAAT
jgi:hypothetical protein